MKTLLLAAAAIELATAPGLRAQTAPRPEFEVATVKSSPPPSDPTRMSINIGTARNGKVALTNASLSDCLKFAYGIVSDDLLSGPDWMRTYGVRYDVVAQAPVDTPRDRLLLMLQTLLEDRLKLAMHHEQRQLRYLALEVGKNGPKIRKAQVDISSSTSQPQLPGRIAGIMPLSTVATLLSRFERETVVDLTGLMGPYEIALEWMPEDRRAISGDVTAATAPAADGASGASLFTAVQEQLGLKLESRKGPLDVLVVDHAEKAPTEN
ncbi:MAG TPA: TIGR03435 family protein [Bryobacteraceae bacterium]|nr:TIGR03435 family protein [Bryobacteraceae bacterium]